MKQAQPASRFCLHGLKTGFLRTVLASCLAEIFEGSSGQAVILSAAKNPGSTIYR
jgi:hypothetical protein